MSDTKPIEQGFGIHCCICLNISGDLVPAITLVHGYAVCENHVKVVQRNDFDFNRIVLNAKRTAAL